MLKYVKSEGCDFDSMKVYVKKDRKKNVLLGVIVMSLFIIIPIAVILRVLLDNGTFLDKLANWFIPVTWSLVLFYFGASLFYGFIKKPAYFGAVLISKSVEFYNGQKITNMTFKVNKPNRKEDDLGYSHFSCYTIGENDLVLEKKYLLYIKEFSWKVRRVEECLANEYREKEMKSVTLRPVFIAVEIMFLSIVIACVLGIVFYPEFIVTYACAGVLMLIPCITIIVMLVKYEKDDAKNKVQNNEMNKYYKLLASLRPLEQNKKIAVNTMVLGTFIMMTMQLAFSVLFLLILRAIFPFPLVIVMLLPLIVFVIPQICTMIFYSRHENRVIRKRNINIPESSNIENLNSFHVFKSSFFLPHHLWFVVNQDNNLIFKIKKNGIKFFRSIYDICDVNDVRIGRIRSKIFSLSPFFIINMVNESPFLARLKIQVHHNYQIVGRDYYVKGTTHGTENVVVDNNDEELAYIEAVDEKGNGWRHFGHTRVILKEDTKDKIDILTIAVCVTMGNLKRKRSVHK